MKLLVAEDDPLSRRMLASAVQSTTVEVLVASDGIEAVRLVEEHAPPVILLDWQMPLLDGLSVCRIIRERASAFRPHIIMVTCRDSTDDVVAAFAAGADDYVTKPYDLAQLRARVWAGIRLALRDEAFVHERSRLKTALAQLHSLPDVVPICASCKRVRAEGEWYPIDQFVSRHAGVHFSHGLCPECVKAFV